MKTGKTNIQIIRIVPQFPKSVLFYNLLYFIVPICMFPFVLLFAGVYQVHEINVIVMHPLYNILTFFLVAAAVITYKMMAKKVYDYDGSDETLVAANKAALKYQKGGMYFIIVYMAVLVPL